MKTHSRLGFQALEQAEEEAEQPVAFLRMAKEITLSHHEKWDGSGYPDRLAGETIPISARLMALADVFDALITPAPLQAGVFPGAGTGDHPQRARQPLRPGGRGCLLLACGRIHRHCRTARQAGRRSGIAAVTLNALARCWPRHA
jgi:hypothetical protein